MWWRKAGVGGRSGRLRFGACEHSSLIWPSIISLQSVDMNSVEQLQDTDSTDAS